MEPLFKSRVSFSGNKIFRFKAHIAENSPLLLRFVTQKRDIFALKKQFMTYSEVPYVSFLQYARLAGPFL